MKFRLCRYSAKALRYWARTPGSATLGPTQFLIDAHHMRFARCDIVTFTIKCIHWAGRHVRGWAVNTGRMP